GSSRLTGQVPRHLPAGEPRLRRWWRRPGLDRPSHDRVVRAVRRPGDRARLGAPAGRAGRREPRGGGVAPRVHRGGEPRLDRLLLAARQRPRQRVPPPVRQHPGPVRHGPPPGRHVGRRVVRPARDRGPPGVQRRRESQLVLRGDPDGPAIRHRLAPGVGGTPVRRAGAAGTAAAAPGADPGVAPPGRLAAGQGPRHRAAAPTPPPGAVAPVPRPQREGDRRPTRPPPGDGAQPRHAAAPRAVCTQPGRAAVPGAQGRRSRSAGAARTGDEPVSAGL
ncbi:MAG: hypothetical protein AVDCRST_MAG64-2197, partial [uncultured Phycisphaerae bacterium]